MAIFIKVMVMSTQSPALDDSQFLAHAIIRTNGSHYCVKLDGRGDLVCFEF